jgi:hypothetical protein
VAHDVAEPEQGAPVRQTDHVVDVAGRLARRDPCRGHVDRRVVPPCAEVGEQRTLHVGERVLLVAVHELARLGAVQAVEHGQEDLEEQLGRRRQPVAHLLGCQEHDVAVGDGRDGGAPPVRAEGPHLAEHLAGLDGAEHLAVADGLAAPTDEYVRAVGRAALREDDLARRDRRRSPMSIMAVGGAGR